MPSLLKEFNFVKGFLAHEEGILLYEMAKKYCTKSFAVEIGSYCGKSACYIGQACKEKGTHLVTIDHHRGSEEQQFGEEYLDFVAEKCHKSKIGARSIKSMIDNSVTNLMYRVEEFNKKGVKVIRLDKYPYKYEYPLMLGAPNNK